MNRTMIGAALVVLLCTGCETDYRMVECDSGFSTGNAYSAKRNDGVIYWKMNQADTNSSRKMLPGEICTYKFVEKDH